MTSRHWKTSIAVTVAIFFACSILYVRKEVNDVTKSSGRVEEMDRKINAMVSLTAELVHQRKLTGVQMQRNDVITADDDDDGAPEKLKHLRRHGVSYGLASRNISKMTKQEIELSMYSTLDQTSTVCHRKLRMGKIYDGGWEICDDVDVRPRQPCVIYSFGINNDFSFDDAIADVYGCHVYSFDPSMKQETYNRSSKVHFYKIGLSGKTGVDPNLGWEMKTFSDIRTMLGHENTHIDVVKMDIERSEWNTLPQMFEAGEMKNFKQFLIEFHLNHLDANRLRMVQTLELEGFKVFYTHKNPACKRNVPGYTGAQTGCYEVHYVRRP